MESKTKLLGHPIHPMLIVFPLGLLVSSFIFDVLYYVTDSPSLAVVSFWNIVAGIVGGLAAAIFGFADWSAIPSETRAKRIGMWHGLGNVVMLLLFAISWLLRLADPANEPGLLAFVLSLLGVSLGGVTGWLGGELVDRLGIGVDPGANPDAPNSLTDEPASPNQVGYRGGGAEPLP